MITTHELIRELSRSECGSRRQGAGENKIKPCRASWHGVHRQPVMDAEGQVAEALLALVRRAPEGQTPGAQLCSRLYCQCPDARAIVHAHHGLKGFIEGSELLKGRVCFVADQVC